jgi:hypothetical protein
LLFPQPAGFASDPGTLARRADVLAREATAHDVDNSSPRPSVETSDIVPNWESWKHSVTLSLQEDSSAEWLNLNRTDAGMSEKDSAKDSSPASSKKV